MVHKAICNWGESFAIENSHQQRIMCLFVDYQRLTMTIAWLVMTSGIILHSLIGMMTTHTLSIGKQKAN